MKTIKFSIKVGAIDSYIYGGHLFVILKDGRIAFTELSKVIRKLVDKYSDFENLIRLSFQRNDYLSNRQGLMILGVGELRNVLMKLWERATNEIDFSIDFDLDDFEIISEVPSMPVLDMRLYAMRMYLGCKEGLYELNLNPQDNYHLKPSKPELRFDAKVTHLNAKSGEVIISANSEGLFHGSFLNKRNKLEVISKPVAKKSIRTGWSSYDVINYEEHNNFEYFVNETASIDNKPKYSKFDEQSERRRITEFGKSKYGMAHLMGHSNLKVEDVSYCFNSSLSGFFFTKDGQFININLNKENKQDLYFTSRNHLLPNLEKTKKLLTKPVSSSIVPKGCVIEYFDKVVLYHNGKAKVIENSPSINVRSYPSSIRYRNLITITKDEEISIHSIYPFDETAIKLTFDDFSFDNIFND
ncbi:MAG: hypothetical protein RIE86_26885 [Imperialibacter sp.]|uniref:hypothetical protein n=1 Tax=Imperialibacter sp. TaxID=2038411 RepID=UPI0032ED2D40